MAGQQALVDEMNTRVDERLAGAEAARLAGDCERRSRILESLDEYISSTSGGFSGRVYLPPQFIQSVRRRVAEALSRPCPPLADQTGISPTEPSVVLHAGTGELDASTQAGTGFQRPSGGGEIFAGRNANVIRMHTYGLVLAALAWRQWLLSGSVMYSEGDERSRGRVPDGTGIDTGFVYGDFSPGNSTGVAIADRGLDWFTESEASALNLKLKAVRATSGPLSWFLFADYLSSQRDYDSGAMAEVFGETLSQERRQKVSDDLIGGGVGLQFQSRAEDRIMVGGWTSAGVFHRSSELEAWERNVCPLCGPADRDFILRFDEKDDGVTWSLAAGVYAAFPLSQNMVFGVGADVAYIDEVGAVFNPSSGDQVFVDGLSTGLTTTDAVQYNFRLGVRVSF